MSKSFSERFLTREFEQRSDWRWWTAVLAGAAALFLPMIIAALIILVFAISGASMADFGSGTRPKLTPAALSMVLIVSQILTIIFTFGFARYKTVLWQSKLYITGLNKLRDAFVPILAIAVLIIFGTVFWEYFFQSTLENDGNSLKELLLSPNTQFAAIIAAVVGAPVAEEMLFRGFLLPPLAKTRLGFIGAAIITSLCWAVIHGYSWQGAVEIFFIGLGFSYLLWRTGSILSSILLHMLFNAVFVGITLFTATS